MKAEATPILENILTIIKNECQKANVDISTFNFQGAYAKYTTGNPLNSELNEEVSVSLRNTNLSTLDIENFIKLTLIQNNLNQQYCRVWDVVLVPELIAGSKFFPVQSNCFETNELVSLKLENGITVIDFWTESCTPSVDVMNQNFQIIEKNFEKWNGKVKFFTSCQSTPEQKADKLKFIAENNWNKFPEMIQHCYRTSDNLVSLIYGVQFTPFIIIADKRRILRYVGVAALVEIEKLVNEILEENESAACAAEVNPLNPESKQALEPCLAQKFDDFQNDFKQLYAECIAEQTKGGSYNMNFQMMQCAEFFYKIEIGAIEEFKFSSNQLSLSCKKSEHKAFTNLLKNHLTQAESEAENNNVKLELIETFDVEIPESCACALCQSTISKEALTFCCPECKLFFCANCVKARKGKSGFEALVHSEHYLIAFKNPNPENLKNLEKYKLGKNLFAQMPEDMLNHEHGFGCNGFANCGESETFSERFICLNCRPGALSGNGFVDICGDCFLRICETGDKPENAEEHANDHVYLHMVYAGVFYNDY